MKKEAIIIIAISFLSFVLTNGMVYYFYNQNLQKEEMKKKKAMIADSLKNIKYPKFSLLDAYQRLEKLQNYVSDSLYTDSLHTITNNDLKYLQSKINAQLDTLKFFINVSKEKIDSLSTENKLLTTKLDTNKKIIQDQKEKISSLKKGITKSKNSEEQAKKDKAYKYLAQTYDSMDPEKVAQQMQSLKDEKIIEVLKRMNQRKAGKVLEAFPINVSARIASKITD